MTLNVSTLLSHGTYFWKLILQTANPNQKGTIQFDYKITKKISVNTKEFLQRKANVTSNYTYGAETSVDLKFNTATASQKLTFSAHLEMADELVRSSETARDFSEESVQSWHIDLEPQVSISIFQLCYSSEGVLYETETHATNPTDEITVELTYTLTKTLLGLADLNKQLQNTFPRSQNKKEWEAIRNTIVAFSDKSQEQAFQGLLGILSNTFPENANKREWAAIRQTCAEILADWGVLDKQPAFKKLLTRLSTTFPEHDNTEEWNAIRDTSNRILASLQQVWGVSTNFLFPSDATSKKAVVINSLIQTLP